MTSFVDTGNKRAFLYSLTNIYFWRTGTLLLPLPFLVGHRRVTVNLQLSIRLCLGFLSPPPPEQGEVHTL